MKSTSLYPKKFTRWAFATAVCLLIAGTEAYAAEEAASEESARAKILREKYGLHEETIRTLEEINRTASGSSKRSSPASNSSATGASKNRTTPVRGSADKPQTTTYKKKSTPRAITSEKKKKRGIFSIFSRKKEEKPDYKQKAIEEAARLKKRREQQEAARLKIEAERKAREAKLARPSGTPALSSKAATRPATVVLPPRPNPTSPRDPDKTALPQKRVSDPVLRVGLILSIAIYNHGEIEVKADQHRIAQNGTITLPLIGSIEAAGKTLEDLTRILTEKYQTFLKNPQVSADFVVVPNDVTTMPWGHVTVLGRVKKPGRIQLPVSRTIPLSTAIQSAGGFNTSAKTKAVKVTRKYANGQSKEFVKNLKNLGEDGSVDDMDLLPNDVIYIPERIF